MPKDSAVTGNVHLCGVNLLETREEVLSAASGGGGDGLLASACASHVPGAPDKQGYQASHKQGCSRRDGEPIRGRYGRCDYCHLHYKAGCKTTEDCHALPVPRPGDPHGVIGAGSRSSRDSKGEKPGALDMEASAIEVVHDEGAEHYQKYCGTRHEQESGTGTYYNEQSPTSCYLTVEGSYH